MRALERVLSIGTLTQPASEAKHIRISNGITGMSAVLILGYMSIFLAVGEPDAAIALAAVLPLYPLALWLQHVQRRRAALNTMGIAAMAATVAGTLLAPGDAGAYLFCIVTLFATWLVAPPRLWTLALVWTLVQVAVLLGCYVAVRDRVPGEVTELLRLLNLSGVALTSVAFAIYSHRALATADRDLAAERKKTDDLLHNVLPASIAARLKDGGSVSDRFEAATVLFADLAGFTPRAEKLSPDRVVATLDDIFRRFDRLCAQHGLEKIKTIGDAYMAAAGIPSPVDDHVARTADLALAMQQEIAAIGDGVELRVGIHTGPVVAGVIGERKFAYDLWGDTVNTASRMESHGIPGRIQVTAGVYEILHGRYAFESRGEIAVKGKGTMPVYLLVGKVLGDRPRADGVEVGSTRSGPTRT